MLKKRTYPYPILLADSPSSRYENSTFNFNYEKHIEGSNFVINNISYEIYDDNINCLLNKGDAIFMILIKCPSRLFSQNFYGTNEISINVANVIGELEITAYVIAQNELINFYSNNFKGLYKNYKFTIEKYSLLAKSDSFKTKVNIDEEKNSKNFFIVVEKQSLDNVSFEFNQDSIQINLPSSEYQKYNRLKQNMKLTPIFISMYGVSALTFAIYGLFADSKNSIDENLINNKKYEYQWFDSFCEKFREIKNKEFEIDDIQDNSIFLVSQKMFDSPLNKTIDILYKNNLVKKDD